MLLDLLNKEQKLAAQQINGPVLVLAGAGSGKTRVLTLRIAHMVLEMGINPESILAITFTNKAAKEMKERVGNILKENIFISTFHAFALFLLRRHCSVLGFENNFNIYDMEDQKKLISQITKKLNIDIGLQVQKIADKISKMKELKIKPHEASNRGFYEIYDLYEKELRKNNAIDFADILVYADKLLDNPEILFKVQERFKYFLIDEYQDTNHIQYSIVKKLALKDRNIFVVGDENQGIYSFRGANINNILNFEKDYTDAAVFKLEENYRSTSKILDAANSVISNNRSSLGKKLWTSSGEGEHIRLFFAEDSKKEAKYVASNIQSSINHKYSDFTVLYRNNFQSREIEEEFIRQGIPFKIYGGQQFYQRKEIKDILGYLRLLNNPNDQVSFLRIINLPNRGIGAMTQDKLIQIISDKNVNCFEVLDIALEEDGFSTTLKNHMKNFKLLLEEMSTLKHLHVSELLEYIVKEVNYISYLRETNEEERIANVEELLSASKDAPYNLNEYLENIALASALDVSSGDFVQLMTVHSSKGLEFKNVFLIGLEEELFPHANSMFSGDIEEERRLFYVAITRARERLYLSYALSRNVYRVPSSYRVKSRFLDEIPSDLLLHDTICNVNKKSTTLYRAIEDMKKKKIENKIAFEKTSREKLDNLKHIVGFSLGEKVHHEAFGYGRIISLNLDRIVILFDQEGEKRFVSSTVKRFITKA